jgi:Ca2+-binding RTX toxin-like protein
MAWQSPVSSSSAGTIDLGESDDLFLAAQVAYTVAAGLALSADGSNQSIIILGTLAGRFGAWMGNDIGLDGGNLLDVRAGGRLQAFESFAIRFYGSGTTENAGTISSLNGNAVEVRNSNLTNPGSLIINTGLIEGGVTGIDINASVATSTRVLNSGTITGAVRAYFDASTAAQRDTIINTGLIDGDVLLRDGDDVFDSRNGRFNDRVDGGAGNDRLYTGAGAQTLNGNDGNDTLIGGAGGDRFVGGIGFDIVSYSSATSGVTANLLTGGTRGDADGDVFERTIIMSSIFVDIEGLSGSAFGDNLTGSNAANRIVGGAGNDVLNGGAGNDTLFGQAGRDSFLFNTTLGSANVDRISDYRPADDTIRIDNAVFVGIGATGALATSAFRANTTGQAGDTSDRIIYNTGNGALYFDADGSGAGGRALFAFVAPGLAMTAAEFLVV